MRFLILSIPLLLTSACVTEKVVYKPLYLEAQIERPTPPDLKDVEIKYSANPPMFILTPEAYDTLNQNIQKTGKYIDLLIEGWEFYEAATDGATEDK